MGGKKLLEDSSMGFILALKMLFFTIREMILLFVFISPAFCFMLFLFKVTFDKPEFIQTAFSIHPQDRHGRDGCHK
jgi:hypothetical protein